MEKIARQFLSSRLNCLCGRALKKNASSCQTAAAAHLLWPNEWSGRLVAHCGESVLGSHPCVVPIAAIWRFDAINVYTRSAAAAAVFFFVHIVR
jgi:hypothetical protein